MIKRSVAAVAMLMVMGCGASAPGAGAPLDSAFWRTFIRPDLPVGTRLTYAAEYSTVSLSGQGSTDTSTAEHTLTVQSDGSLGGAPDISADLKTPPNMLAIALDLFAISMLSTLKTAPDMTLWRSAGPEDITVPAGSFPGAARISRSESGWNYTDWYAPSAGLVCRIGSSGLSQRRLELKTVARP